MQLVGRIVRGYTSRVDHILCWKAIVDMSNSDSAWVKEASSVLGEDPNEEQTSPFQITMPYVVLQIMQRLEPNHSVQVNATGTSGLFCVTHVKDFNWLADSVFITHRLCLCIGICYFVNSCITFSPAMCFYSTINYLHHSISESTIVLNKIFIKFRIYHYSPAWWNYQSWSHVVSIVDSVQSFDCSMSI